HVEDEDFAVAYAACASILDYVFGYLLHFVVVDPHANLDLGQKRHAVLAARVAVEITLLPAIPFGFADDAGHHVQIADGPQHLFGTKRLYHDGELFHPVCLRLSWARPRNGEPFQRIVSSD